jgi:hypothetical protein
MADRLAQRRARKRERQVIADEIDQEGSEVMPCVRCWEAKPRRKCVMLEGKKACSSCVRAGKKCSGPNVADACECALCALSLLRADVWVVVTTLNEQRKTAKEIAETEEQLAQVLSRLSRLRKQHEALRARTSGLFERGLEGLEEESESSDPRPVSEEQQLVGQAQALGGLGVVDWEAIGVAPYGSALVDPFAGFEFPSAPPLVDPGSVGGTHSASQGSGGS